MKLKKEDTVKIISGKDKGKTGRVIRLDHENGKVMVQGLNMVKKAKKPRSQNDKGGIIDIEAALNVSKVMILCKKCGPTRIGMKFDGGTKTRICRKCGEAL